MENSLEKLNSWTNTRDVAWPNNMVGSTEPRSLTPFILFRPIRARRRPSLRVSIAKSSSAASFKKPRGWQPSTSRSRLTSNAIHLFVHGNSITVSLTTENLRKHLHGSFVSAGDKNHSPNGNANLASPLRDPFCRLWFMCLPSVYRSLAISDSSKQYSAQVFHR